MEGLYWWESVVAMAAVVRQMASTEVPNLQSMVGHVGCRRILPGRQARKTVGFSWHTFLHKIMVLI